MNLHGLRAFVVVADEGGVTRAAEFLGYSQSAVSRQLAELERNLGGPLFDRERAGMRLTDRGQAALPTARQIVDLVDRALLKRNRLLAERKTDAPETSSTRGSAAPGAVRHRSRDSGVDNADLSAVMTRTHGACDDATGAAMVFVADRDLRPDDTYRFIT